MWFTDKWKEYRLLGGAAGEKKEVWGKYTYPLTSY